MSEVPLYVQEHIQRIPEPRTLDPEPWTLNSGRYVQELGDLNATLSFREAMNVTKQQVLGLSSRNAVHPPLS